MPLMVSAGNTLVETDACPDEICKGLCLWTLKDIGIVRMLGEGRTSTVSECRCRRTGFRFAMKSYHKDSMTMRECKQVAAELAIHSLQEHPNIIPLYAAFEDLDSIHLIQEFAPNGDLYKLLGSSGGYLSEELVATSVIKPLLSALASLHSQGMIHRDIKPENILLAADNSIRLADFGVAIDTSMENPTARVGTLDYFSPECVLSRVSLSRQAPSRSYSELQAYGAGVDIWALGIMTYELLLGGPPFEADTKEETLHRIIEEEPFLPSAWSSNARLFICQALTKDPARRPSAKDLLQHSWLQQPTLSGD